MAVEAESILQIQDLVPGVLDGQQTVDGQQPPVAQPGQQPPVVQPGSNPTMELLSQQSVEIERLRSELLASRQTATQQPAVQPLSQYDVGYGLTADQLAEHRDLIPIIEQVATVMATRRIQADVQPVLARIDALEQSVNQATQNVERFSTDQVESRRAMFAAEVNRQVFDATQVTDILSRVGVNGELYTAYVRFGGEYADKHKAMTNLDLIKAAVGRLDYSAVARILIDFVKSTQQGLAATNSTEDIVPVTTAGASLEAQPLTQQPTEQEMSMAVAKYERLIDDLSRRRISRAEYDVEYAKVAGILGIK